MRDDSFEGLMSRESKRFLVILSIPEGMVAVIRHTVHGLLLAEMTDREPVVDWSDRFLYSPQGTCGLGRFFVNSFRLQHSGDTTPNCTYAPCGWSRDKLADKKSVLYHHDEKRPGFAPLGIGEILRSDARVVVYSHWQHLADILPHLDASSVYHGLSNTQVAGRVFRKYLAIRPEILVDAERLLESDNGAGRIIGVHCRGSDKVSEHALVTPVDYRRRLDQVLVEGDRVFLATDSIHALEQFQTWYGERLLFIDCERSSTAQGVHFTARDREKAGRDFLTDAYILSKCAVHFGNEGSHVSYLVQAMLKSEGEPYDNFVNVAPGRLSHCKRLLGHQVPAWTRRQVGGMMRKIGLIR